MISCNFLNISNPILYATSGDTALPICTYCSLILPVKIYSSGKDGEVKYVGYIDSSFFIFLTHLFLSISDALILAFPFMFFFASLGSIFYRLYNSSFKVNIFQKIIAIFLIVATLLATVTYMEKEGTEFLTNFIAGVVGVN